MHGRIFQLTKEAISTDDYISEGTFWDTSFVGSIADYVSDDVNRDEDMSDFLDHIGYGILYEPTEQSIVFPKGFKESYFKKRFEAFKSAIANASINDFMDDYTVYRYRSLLEETYDYYIYDDDLYPKTLDSFVRNLQEEEKYYIGGVVDYHH